MGGGMRELKVASFCCVVVALLLLLLLMETSTHLTSFPAAVGGIKSSMRQPVEGAWRMREAGGAAAKGTTRKAESERGGRYVMMTTTTVGPGSYPPRCAAKCGRCRPCRAVHMAVPPVGTPVITEYYPEAWRCKCGDRVYVP